MKYRRYRKPIKKINSIWYGGRIVLAGCVLLVIVPTAGGLVLAAFAILLAVELHQDKKMNAYYIRQQCNKRSIGMQLYECQACGNRHVRKTDVSCSICGIRFTKRE